MMEKTSKLNQWLQNNRLNVKSSLYEIIFNISDICSRQCSFCPRGNGYINPHEPFMSDEVFTKVLNDCGENYTGMFSFSDFGEPTLNDKLPEYINQIKAICPNASILITTNGDFLDKISNITGVNIIISKYDDISIPTLKSPYKIKELSSAQKHFYNRGGNVPIEGIVPQQCCYMPFYKMNIDVNGDVILCSSDWYRKALMGNVLNENIFDIWNNDMYKTIRLTLLNNDRKSLQLCSQCNINGLVAGKEFKEFWRGYYDNKRKS